MLSITGPYAAILGIYAIVLGAIVSLYRAKTGISILHGDNVALAEKMRRHGNFAESVPLALILMAIAELQGLAPLWLHICGVSLLAGRLVHPFGIKHENPNNVLRGIGSGLTTLTMLIAIVWILWGLVAA